VVGVKSPETVRQWRMKSAYQQGLVWLFNEKSIHPELVADSQDERANRMRRLPKRLQKNPAKRNDDRLKRSTAKLEGDSALRIELEKATAPIKSPLDDRTYDPNAYIEHVEQHSDAVWVGDEEDIRSSMPDGDRQDNAIQDPAIKVEWEDWDPDLAAPPEDPERFKR
jgi:hypothetical protein